MKFSVELFHGAVVPVCFSSPESCSPYSHLPNWHWLSTLTVATGISRCLLPMAALRREVQAA